MHETDKKTHSEGVKDVAADVRALLEHAATLGMKEVPTASAVPPPASMLSPAEKAKALAELRVEMGDCKRCGLHKGRTHLVFGVGNPDARLMFVGEGPGQEEDLQGEPFVGAAGQLLTKIIEAMGLRREDVYIANIVKSRPPNNRNPEPDEVAACIPFLHRQIEIIAPRVIVCLGSVAMQNLLGTDEKISRLRGKFTEWRGIQVMPTYHPAFLLRNANMKKPVWEDMKKVMERLSNK
ncbi:MAG: uracil-DNA glycosylase [bacterium]